MGRPSKLTQKLADTICERLALGETLTRICQDEEMPDRGTVWRWQNADAAFRDAYARAREAQMDAWADEILDVSDDGTNDWMERRGEENAGWALNGEHVQRSRLRVDTRKFLMSKIAPNRYGEKVQVDHGATDGFVGLVREIARKNNPHSNG